VSWLTAGDSQQRQLFQTAVLLFFSGFPFILSVLFLKKLPSPVSSFPLLFPFSLYFISLFGSFSPPFGSFCFLLCFCFFSLRFFFLFSQPLSFSLLSPPAWWRCGGVFIGQKGAGASLLPPYSSAWGAGLCCPPTASGWLANGWGWQGAAPLVFPS